MSPVLTNKTAVRLLGTFVDTAGDLVGQLLLPLATSVIAGEAVGLSAIAENIVDTHGNKIDANAAIATNLLADLQLGADSDEASSERFQQVDEAFRVLQEKFAKGRRNISENDDEPLEFDIKHTAPQHRQYLSNDGIGIGTPFQRQKQYQQVRAMKAQERVLEHRIEKAAAGESDLMQKKPGGGSYYGKHAIKTKYGIERVVEDLIQEAMSKGDFNNLNGAGKPLSTAQMQNPYLDFTTHKLNKIMLDNGFTPEWIMMSRDIREAVQELKQQIRKERSFYGDWPLTNSDQQAAWQSFAQLHEEQVRELNKLIDKYNLIVPILENQFFRQHLDKLAESIFKEPNLQRNLPRPKQSVKSKAEVKERNFMVTFFSSMGF